jgi:hypothetical protein
VTFLRKVERQNRSEEHVGNLNEDARTVTGIHFGTRRTTMIHVAKSSKTMAHDLMAALALHMNDKIDATGVVFETGVVETLCAGEPREAIWGHASSCVAWIGRLASARRNLGG